MLSWLQRIFASPIGKKALMALSGLGLMVFLVGHLAGNLTLYADAEGTLFDAYANTLRNNPALPLIEIGLFLVFVVHIAIAFRVSVQNREARESGYAVRATQGKSTFASGSMMITGSIVLVFLVIHLIDFRLDERAHDGLAVLVRERLGTPLGALIYIVGVIVLTIHLSHAFRSALQSLGLHHPKAQLAVQRAGLALALALGLGFLSFPIVIFLNAGGA